MSAPVHLALGDSMSIDLYPVLDLRDRERIPSHASPAAGAASLLHRNDDQLWSEFQGRDLATLQPALQILNTCMDGATIGHTADVQLRSIDEPLGAAVRAVTLTTGGNDLLGGMLEGIDGLDRVVEVASRRYGDLVEQVARRFPAAPIVLTTVYDPTDGTGQLPGLSELVGDLPIELLNTFNDAVRELATGADRCLLADVHHHFLGHGLPAAEHERWYWNTSPIEPGARGASEIRRVWLEALQTTDLWRGRETAESD